MADGKRGKTLRRILRIAESGDVEAAMAMLRRWVDAEPTEVDPRVLLAELTLREGDAASALAQARVALGLAPGNDRVAGVAAAAAHRIDRAAQLVDMGKELVTARPDDPDAHRALMWLSVSAGDLYEAAIAAEWLVDHGSDVERATEVLDQIAASVGLDRDEEDAALAELFKRIPWPQVPLPPLPLPLDPALAGAGLYHDGDHDVDAVPVPPAGGRTDGATDDGRDQPAERSAEAGVVSAMPVDAAKSAGDAIGPTQADSERALDELQTAAAEDQSVPVALVPVPALLVSGPSAASADGGDAVEPVDEEQPVAPQPEHLVPVVPPAAVATIDDLGEAQTGEFPSVPAVPAVGVVDDEPSLRAVSADKDDPDDAMVVPAVPARDGADRVSYGVGPSASQSDHRAFDAHHGHKRTVEATPDHEPVGPLEVPQSIEHGGSRDFHDAGIIDLRVTSQVAENHREGERAARPSVVEQARIDDHRLQVNPVDADLDLVNGGKPAVRPPQPSHAGDREGHEDARPPAHSSLAPDRPRRMPAAPAVAGAALSVAVVLVTAALVVDQLLVAVGVLVLGVVGAALVAGRTAVNRRRTSAQHYEEVQSRVRENLRR